MMETVNSGSDTCPVKSDPASASAINSSTLKVRTPAEINREFDATSNSAESLDRLDSFSSLDLASPNDTSFPSLDLLSPNNTSFPRLLTESHVKELSKKVQESGKSRYPAFEKTTSPAPGKGQKKNYVGVNISNFTSFPKTTSSTNPVVFDLRSERQAGISSSFFKSCLVKSSSSEKLQDRSGHAPIKFQERTGHAPIKFAKVQIGSERPTPVTLTGQNDKPDRVPKLTLYNLQGNLITTTLATRSYPTTSVSAKSAIDELGTRPGGGTGAESIKHPGQGKTAKQTGFICRRLNFESSSVSLASSPGESVKSKVGVERSISGQSVEGNTASESVPNKPSVEGSTACDSVQNKPSVEGSTAWDSVQNKPNVEGSTVCESLKNKCYVEGSIACESLKNKPYLEENTPGNSVQNKPGVERTSIWKNSLGSGQIANTTVPQTIEINKRNDSTSSANKTAKKPRRRSREVWETAKPVSNVSAKEKPSFATEPNLKDIHSEMTVKFKNAKSRENVNQDSRLNKDTIRDEEVASEPIEGEYKNSTNFQHFGAKYPIDVKISEYFCKRPNQLSGYNISQSLKDQFVNDESLPFGWKIKKTWRQNQKNYDIEYLSPDGRKARSKVAVIEYMKLLGNYSQKDDDTIIPNYDLNLHKKVPKSREEDRNSSSKQFSSAEQSHVRNTHQGFGKDAYAVNSQDNKKKNDEQHSKINKYRKRKGVNISEQNNNVAPKIANSLTESTLGDFSSGFTKKMDGNDNLDDKCEVKNYDCSSEGTSPATGTEDCARKKLLDGVVMAISGYEDPLRGQIARKAVAMGAKYRTEWTNDCSHLVCGFPGTFKYLQAKGRGEIVFGTWIEDCYKSKKKVDCGEYILSEEKNNKPAEVRSSPSDGSRFLAGMEVRLKGSCLGLLKGQLFKQMADKIGLVRGIFHDRVQVMMPCCTLLLVSPTELEPLLPEKGDKAKSIVKGHGEDVMEVISVGEGAAVVRYDGYKGALVQRNHLCRIAQDKPFP